MSAESESKSAESEFHDSNFADEFLEIDYDSPLLDFKHTTLFQIPIVIANEMIHTLLVVNFRWIYTILTIMKIIY